MLPNKNYPWQNDPHFNIGGETVKPPTGTHLLPRSAKSSTEFSKMNSEVKQILIQNRDELLKSPLPIPFLTESVLNLYNSIHPRKRGEQCPNNDGELEPDYDDISITDDLNVNTKREFELPGKFWNIYKIVNVALAWIFLILN
jgi:hypothetical protein